MWADKAQSNAFVIQTDGRTDGQQIGSDRCLRRQGLRHHKLTLQSYTNPLNITQKLKLHNLTLYEVKNFDVP